MFNSPFNHARKVLQSAYDWYLKKGQTLDPALKQSMESQMLQLEGDIESGERGGAVQGSARLEAFYKEHCRKSFLSYGREFIGAIFVALLLAIVIRQVWFEPYEIPTGSMRPTFREQDHVTVTKTPFGINIPLMTGHFYFDPKLVERGGVVTFTSEGIDRLDEDTNFLWVIPYKKRLVKRMIGKPGDSLYFYGGKIYGVDSGGQPLKELIEEPSMQNLEHLPMRNFNGERSSSRDREILFSQNDQVLARLILNSFRHLEGQIYINKQWVRDDPAAAKKPHSEIATYSDFFGMGNFAMARLLTKREFDRLPARDKKGVGEGELYLELFHHANLAYPEPQLLAQSWPEPQLKPLKTWIPLEQRHLDALMEHMYTARLVFKNGRATRYSVDGSHFNSDSPHFQDVPDGAYEFYDGKLSEIGRGGVAYDVDVQNPLYRSTAENVQKLFNLGIEMHNAYQPNRDNDIYLPTRYAYFRDGDLYLLGSPIFKDGDPVLKAFIEREQEHQKQSADAKPYIAFIDRGAPLLNGKYDVERIRNFGLKVPDRQYYLLGDNHAMSADSRVWGFVPEENLQGAPSLILWPPGPRWGIPDQRPYALIAAPRLIVWGFAAIAWFVWWLLHRRYLHRKIQLKP